MRRINIPLTVKMPAVVIAFMAIVAFFVSERVLTRLQEAQTRHVADLATVYLDGLASALVDPVVREDVWEIFDTIDRGRQLHAGLRPDKTVVADIQGRILASSDPRAYPSSSPLPASFLGEPAAAPAVVIREDESLAVSRRDLAVGGQAVGSVHATFDIAPLLAERRSVLLALVGTNFALTTILAAAAWLTVSRMISPIRTLTSHLQAGADTPVEPIPDDVVNKAPREFRSLFSSFNGMTEAVREREHLLRMVAEEERLASLGRLASGMAHEINNPLGGLFAAIDTLKEHGERSDVRHKTLDLIDRGLKGIRDVVRTTLVTYRADSGSGSIGRADIDDLKLLVQPVASRQNLTLIWSVQDFPDLDIAPSLVRQVLLNLLLNACQATPPGGEVSLTVSLEGARFVAVVDDSGPGLSISARQVLSGQKDHVASLSGTGLGLWMVRRLVKEAKGAISVSDRAPAGTSIHVTLPVELEGLANVA